ncbi:hypothetical protein G5B30_12235 [Sphingobacterium sp. SGG-5]|uniref:hypothetical protein n=1 Tax=Sphingobacterium sp. SGG-5 TaxID=2710881 RepID=UPI0013EB1C2B|nr:hypothetical protein [Sphingobacterium sp. SGG-5]NGM62684.1 hypothetical protein [Sphingobacterium sp. SGG-5]
MQQFTQNQRRVLLNALQVGRQNAISAKNLAAIIGFPTSSNQVKLRSLITECIELEGDLIGAVTGRPAGFFLINNQHELDRYLDTLESRTRRDNDRRTALINNWNTARPNSITMKQIITI